jgi:RNA polymerase sigma factor (sigma-70 family)
VSVRLSAEQRENAAGFARTASTVARGIAAAWRLMHVDDEFRSIAFEALTRAAFNYKPGPATFSSYAWGRVAWAVLSAARKEKKKIALEASFDAAEEILERAAEEGGALSQIEAATGDFMEAFALGCAAADLGEDGGGEARLLARETYAKAEAALAALPPEKRALFELRYRDGLAWKEIVARLHISERTARDHATEIREKLRKLLGGR